MYMDERMVPKLFLTKESTENSFRRLFLWWKNINAKETLKLAMPWVGLEPVCR